MVAKDTVDQVDFREVSKMAVYEYVCPKCGKEFELMRPMHEADKSAECPNCGSKANKLVSGFGSKTGNTIQPAGEPFRERPVVKEPSRKAGAAKAGRGRAGR